MRELLSELTQALDQGRTCVYCCILETRGSTPQKAGAAMLVFPDGSQRGTLGGGCVEAEVKQRALAALAALASSAGKPDVLTFNLDDNYGWDDGLICGGRMTVLAAPLTPDGPAREYYRTLDRLAGEGRGCTEAIAYTAAGAEAGQRWLFDGDGRLAADLADQAPPEAVTRHLPPLRQRPRAAAVQGVAYLPVLPRITLLIVGAGHVGQAVARLAADLEFEAWVVDDRAAFASAERFPRANRRLVGDIGATLEQLKGGDIDASVYALIMTRGHAHDEEALYHLATTPAGYVGMIGSKRKIKLIYEDLLARGVPADALKRVHAPLGLDIGSQTVPEIAVSILAELIACRNRGATLPAARVHVPVGSP
jgi:xanthine dehydrogenase accessory factor